MDGIPLENPLALELQSLRASLFQFQEEAHQSSVKLQRHSLDSTRAHERAVYHERENDVLKAEIAILRANPLSSSQSNANTDSQIQELTLSLRRLSQKLTLTEESLLSTQTQLVLAQTESKNSKENANNAYELGARVRGREEEGLGRERALEMKVRKLEEELRMSDGVVKEYAALVRGMQARSDSHDHEASTLPTNSNLAEFLKSKEEDLENLFNEFQVTSQSTHQKLAALTHELEVTKSQFIAEQKTNSTLVNELGKIRMELEKLKLDDGTAAKMVARYMQFSQTSTNKLLDTLSNLQTRHSGTLQTMSSQNHALSMRLRSLEAQNASALRALDELGGEILKESYGRRREVMLRIRMNGREERIVEGLRRWVRRGDELLTRLRESSPQEDGAQSALLDMAQHARILLESLEGGVWDEETAISLSGTKGRQILVNDTLERLSDELRNEKGRRITLEKELAIQAGWADDDVPQSLGSNMIEEKPVFSSNVDAPLPPTPIGEEEEIIDDPSLVSPDKQIPSLTNEVDGLVTNAPETPEVSSISEPVIEVEPLEELARFPSSSSSASPSEITETTSSTPSSNTLSAQTVIAAVALSPSPISTEDSPRAQEEVMPPSNQSHVPLPQEQELITVDPITLTDENVFVEQDTTTVTYSPLDELPLEVPSLEHNASIPALSPPLPIVSPESDIDTPPLDTPLLAPSSEILCEEKENIVVPIHESNNVSSLSSLSPSPLSTPPTTKAVPFPLPSNTEDSFSVPAEQTTEIEQESELFVSPKPTISPVSQSPSLPVSPPLPSPSPNHSKRKPHPLLADLARVNQRYDQLQKSFRDCHLALEGLKHALGSNDNSAGHPFSSSSSYGGGIGRGHPSPSSSVHFPSSSLGNGSSQNHASNSFPVEILRAALARLDDYTEDARVELEIRIGDEEMAMKGWEALLSVPGALIPDMKSQHDGDANTRHIKQGDDDDLRPFQTEVEEQIKAFISGDDPAIKKAREGFERKLEDVLHDIAALKTAVYDPAAFDLLDNSGLLSTGVLPSSASTSNLFIDNSNGGEFLSPSSANMAVPNSTSSNGWTSWIRSPSIVSSRPSSPVPAPTFGSIMTSPRSLLRHSSSNVSLKSATQEHPIQAQNHPRPRKGSFFGFSLPLGVGGGGEQDRTHNPLAQLRLRVPMPNFSTISGGGTPMTSPSAAGSNPLTPGIGSARTRTVSSTMYMLGLGQGIKSPGIGMGNATGLSRSVSAGGSSLYGSLKPPQHGSLRKNRQVSEPMVASLSSSLDTGTFPRRNNSAVGLERTTEDDDDEGSEEDGDEDNDTDVE